MGVSKSADARLSSFLLQKKTKLYNRRSAKIVSTIVSAFTSAYVYYWQDIMCADHADNEKRLPAYPPTFDGRAVAYPTDAIVQDYFRWRQADCHINNLYNTTFFALVLKSEPPLSETAAHKRLKGSFSKDKHEILFKEFGIKYGLEPDIFKRGSILMRPPVSAVSSEKDRPASVAASLIQQLHCDLIKPCFWETYPHLLA